MSAGFSWKADFIFWNNDILYFVLLFCSAYATDRDLVDALLDSFGNNNNNYFTYKNNNRSNNIKISTRITYNKQ